jgi:hypothetical protein
MNNYCDFIYIINLEKDKLKKEKCILQLKNNNIINYKFILAESCKYYFQNLEYDNITKKISKDFIKFNFSKGAYGCLLSHIICLEDAKKNGYKKVLILEDDFIIINNFKNNLTELFNNIEDNWDLLYLGKKQGADNCKFNVVDEIHKNKQLFYKVNEINKYIYKPNYRTWATHALLVRDTIYDDIIQFRQNVLGPIDLMLMTLYDKYNFYCVKKDLFITHEESSIQDCSKINSCWNWNAQLYNIIDTRIIKNIIIYGFKNSDHTHKYIHEMYYNFFSYYYPHLNIYWFDNEDQIDNNVTENSIVFCSPCHFKYKNLPISNKIFYILHLDEFSDNLGYKNICDFFKERSNFEIFNNKNYVILTCRENILGLKYFEKSIEKKCICLPWFSNDLYEKILHCKKNIKQIYLNNKNKKYLCYIGSVWYVNVEVIKDLINICIKNKIYLIIKGRVFGLTKQDSDYIINIESSSEFIKFIKFNYKNFGELKENSFEYIDETYGIKALLPLQGNMHDNSYISNRIFETISKGYMVVTNNLLTKNYFTSAVYENNIEDLIINYCKILSDENLWKTIINNQINEYLYKFYGFVNINSIISFIKETTLPVNKLLLFDDYANVNYKVWFVNNNSYTNIYYSVIKNNKDICEALINKKNYIIYPNEDYDIYLIERLISLSNYNIYLDLDVNLKKTINVLCNKYNKTAFYKKPLNICCLLSGQRTGSTLLIEYVQKTQPKVLALSEIFNTYHNCFNYNSSYDVCKGILKGNQFTTLNECKNDVCLYFKQFEDLANYEDYEIILFKITLDFNTELQNYTNLNIYLDFIKNFNIIWLTRNDIECYISKILAEKYGYSNNIYETINNNIFSLQELYNFIQRKEKFMNIWMPLIKKSCIINYNEYIKDENKLYKTLTYIFNYFNISIKLNKNIYCEMNKKQNIHNIYQLCEKKYW